MKSFALSLLVSGLTIFNVHSEDSLKDKTRRVSHERKKYAEKLDKYIKFDKCLRSSKKHIKKWLISSL